MNYMKRVQIELLNHACRGINLQSECACLLVALVLCCANPYRVGALKS